MTRTSFLRVLGGAVAAAFIPITIAKETATRFGCSDDLIGEWQTNVIKRRIYNNHGSTLFALFTKLDTTPIDGVYNWFGK